MTDFRCPRPALKSKSTDLLKISLVTLLLFLLIDFFLGQKLIAIVKPAEPFRTWHPVYHHSLVPNFKGMGHWGTWAYPVCTNSEGFKVHCDKKQTNDKAFDVAFVGDSFTEGLGVPYEKTFVGVVADEMPQLTFANLGVVSYSPSIYLAKLKELIRLGYRFKHIIVFIDISDLYDESIRYDLHNDSIVVDKGEAFPVPFQSQLRRRVLHRLPLTGELYAHFRKAIGPRPAITAPIVEPRQDAVVPTPIAINSGRSSETADKIASEVALRSRLSLDGPIYQRDYVVGEWTYNSQSNSYGSDGVFGTLTKMERVMNEIHLLAQSHGAKLSVGVYPWPGQLMYDAEDSLHVRRWRQFCEIRCAHFYNAFPVFFALVERYGLESVIRDYFIAGDVHFNEKGNEVIARTIVETGIE
jgi:hypothetical protein